MSANLRPDARSIKSFLAFFCSLAFVVDRQSFRQDPHSPLKFSTWMQKIPVIQISGPIRWQREAVWIIFPCKRWVERRIRFPCNTIHLTISVSDGRKSQRKSLVEWQSNTGFHSAWTGQEKNRRQVNICLFGPFGCNLTNIHSAFSITNLSSSLRRYNSWDTNHSNTNTALMMAKDSPDFANRVTQAPKFVE